MQKRCGVADMPPYSLLCLAVSGPPVCFLITWRNEIKQSWFRWQVGLQEELRFRDIERLCLPFNGRALRPAVAAACSVARRPVLKHCALLHFCALYY